MKRQHIQKTAELLFPDWVFFEGVIHPTGKEDTFNGFFFRKKDIKNLAPKINNVDLLLEHKPEKKIGKILGGYMDEKHQFRVMGVVDTTTLPGVLTAEAIRKKVLNSLSMGKYAIQQETPGENLIVDHEIFEISIVENPDLEGTSIDYVQPHNETQLKAMEHRRQRIDVLIQAQKDQNIVSEDTNDTGSFFFTRRKKTTAHIACRFLDNCHFFSNWKEKKKKVFSNRFTFFLF